MSYHADAIPSRTCYNEDARKSSLEYILPSRPPVNPDRRSILPCSAPLFYPQTDLPTRDNKEPEYGNPYSVLQLSSSFLHPGLPRSNATKSRRAANEVQQICSYHNHDIGGGTGGRRLHNFFSHAVPGDLFRFASLAVSGHLFRFASLFLAFSFTFYIPSACGRCAGGQLPGPFRNDHH